MINRLLLLTLCFVGVFLSASADERKKITLNNDNHSSETIELGYGNIILSLKVDQYENVIVSVELENTFETNTLVLFDIPFNEKALRKHHISYDKGFGGSRGKRWIDACLKIQETKRVLPTEKVRLFSLSGTDNPTFKFQLPIYIAKKKFKRGRKLLLTEKKILELEIQTRTVDKEYLNILSAYNALMDSIQSEHFCKNKNHQGESINSLKKKYEGKINNLKNKIVSVKRNRGYFQSDKGWKKFLDIYDKLDAISIDSKIVSSCPNDKKSKHSCNYCNLSYEAIYSKLQNYYIDIYNGKKSKSQVIRDVEALYTCAARNTRRTTNNSDIKARIAEYYNRIKSF